MIVRLVVVVVTSFEVKAVLKSGKLNIIDRSIPDEENDLCYITDGYMDWRPLS